MSYKDKLIEFECDNGGELMEEFIRSNPKIELLYHEFVMEEFDNRVTAYGDYLHDMNKEKEAE